MTCEKPPPAVGEHFRMAVECFEGCIFQILPLRQYFPGVRALRISSPNASISYCSFLIVEDDGMFGEDQDDGYIIDAPEDTEIQFQPDFGGGAWWYEDGAVFTCCQLSLKSPDVFKQI